MCQSLAQGGQRCAAHTRPAYQAVIGDLTLAPTRVTDAELADRVDHRLDAVIDYAATRSGRRQVERDYATLEDNYARFPSTTAAQEAIRQGTLAQLRIALREAQNRSDALARYRSTYPSNNQMRPDPARHNQQVDTSLTIEPAPGEHITDIRFSCENHDAPGQCTEDCAMLVSMMNPTTGVAFDETGTSYPAPKPRQGIYYDPERRMVLEVTFTPDGYRNSDTVAATATRNDEAGAAAQMAWLEANAPTHDNSGYDENGFAIDAFGNAYGYCNSCGAETAPDATCCPDGTVVTTSEFFGD